VAAGVDAHQEAEVEDLSAPLRRVTHNRYLAGAVRACRLSIGHPPPQSFFRLLVQQQLGNVTRVDEQVRVGLVG
jgi:hypothetical protein